MKCLLVMMMLVLSACAAAPAATPEQPQQIQAKNDAFLDCLAKLGQDQSKGYAKCAKLLR
jgi:outer membrane lipoprotein-sorting protein